ncbi:MAG TPA: thioredoxin family protein [bacterium]|nr:thioredoxin family protein [bacterium]HPM57949.1 thioredoxin family protein [bacterium]
MKKLQILGMGCAKCNKLMEMTELAAKELGIEYEIVKVNTLDEIKKFRIMMTPALAVDGVVKVYGRVPGLDELKQMIK